VTLHVPETPQTKNLIGRTQLAAMKKDSHLLNAARGTVVDIDALADALEKKHLAGAALDVFPAEPTGNDEEFQSPLRKFDQVILTPHIGGSTLEAQANIGLEVADKLIRYSNNGSTVTAVNFPEVALPEHAGPGKCRLLHIHRNVPGVLAQINDRFGRHRINISAQYLQTNEHLGYCVMDVDAAASRIAIDELQGVPGTIRARLLY
jgi:D-3-phosphoglycerate dehydrogenase